MDKKIKLDSNKIEYDGNGFKAVIGDPADFDQKLEQMREKVIKQIELEKKMVTFYRCMLRDTLNNKTFLSPYLYETKEVAEKEFLKEKKNMEHIHIDEPFHYQLIGFVAVTMEQS